MPDRFGDVAGSSAARRARGFRAHGRFRAHDCVLVKRDGIFSL
jgi:hypothetical protein